MRMWKDLWKGMALVAAMSVPIGLAGTAQAGPVYDGKLVTLIVPNSPSGKMTQYARLIAPYIAKYIGAKEVRIVNRKGGGGLKGSNILWNSKPDGMTMAFTNVPALIMAQLAGSPGVQFDATKFTYLGRAASEPRVVVVGAHSSIKSAADLKTLKKPFVYASQGTDEDFYTMAVLADSIGYDLKIVTGYEGNSDTQLAVIKGDADGQMMGYISAKPAVENGDQRVIISTTDARNPELPDVPTAAELVGDPAKKATMEAIVTILNLSRTFFGPPGMDPAATAEMRAGITAALTDPELLAAGKKGGFNINPATGEAQQKAVEKVVASSQSLVPIFKKALESIQ